LFARTDLPARAGAGNAYAYADTDSHAHEYADGVPYPLPYPDLDSNAAATHKDAGPHGQPDVNADGYAHEYANGCTNEGADTGLSRHLSDFCGAKIGTGGALRHDVTKG
jgi:hypothetical protein